MSVGRGESSSQEEKIIQEEWPSQLSHLSRAATSHHSAYNSKRWRRAGIRVHIKDPLTESPPLCLSYQALHAMHAVSPFARLLRDAAPKLSRQYFRPCQCTRQPANIPAKPLQRLWPIRSTSFPSAIFKQHRSATTLPAQDVSIPASDAAVKASSFPESSSNTVAYWLLASAASVFGIVVFGGWTRLTESGCILPHCLSTMPVS